MDGTGEYATIENRECGAENYGQPGGSNAKYPTGEKERRADYVYDAERRAATGPRCSRQDAVWYCSVDDG